MVHVRARHLSTALTVLIFVTGCGAAQNPQRRGTPPPPTPPAASPAPPTPTPKSVTPRPSTETKKATAPRRDAKQQAELDAQLIAAAWKNDLRRARKLIHRGADVNAKDHTVQSAYLIATSEGFLELLELTLEHGADVDSKDSFNGTGLIRAADRGHADVAGRLVQAGVKVDHVNNLGWTALHEAVTLGDGSRRYVDTVRVLVAAGADVRLRSSRDNATPLSYARSKGFDRIEVVLQATLDADQPPRRQADQRLLAAAADGDATAAALALRAGADLETSDDHSRTPLLLAVTGNKRAVARLLDYLGADP